MRLYVTGERTYISTEILKVTMEYGCDDIYPYIKAYFKDGHSERFVFSRFKESSQEEQTSLAIQYLAQCFENNENGVVPFSDDMAFEVMPYSKEICRMGKFPIEHPYRNKPLLSPDDIDSAVN